MSGTTIKDLKLTKVVDGDTFKVEINGKVESLRLCCLDTEESWAGGSKPVTNAGKLASKWAKSYFGVNQEGFPGNGDEIILDIEFDTNDPVPVCLKKHRGNFGRLICYVHKGDENYNLKAVENGWSPYFVKYGRSRLYHEEFLEAEANAQSSRFAIWDPTTNAAGNSRSYGDLIPWWYLRDSVVQGYRQSGIHAGVKSVRLDYEDIIEAAMSNCEVTVLCDLQMGINKWPGDGALIYAGSQQHKFNLWIPDRESQSSQLILNLIDTRYSGRGRGYAYISGKSSLYPQNDSGKPQIVLNDVKQLSDMPLGE